MSLTSFYQTKEERLVLLSNEHIHNYQVYKSESTTFKYYIKP